MIECTELQSAEVLSQIGGRISLVTCPPDRAPERGATTCSGRACPYQVSPTPDLWWNHHQRRNFPMPKDIAIVSGGLDSITLTYLFHAEGYEFHVLSFDYGQCHKKELAYAERCAKRLNAV